MHLREIREFCLPIRLHGPKSALLMYRIRVPSARMRMNAMLDYEELFVFSICARLNGLYANLTAFSALIAINKNELNFFQVPN